MAHGKPTRCQEHAAGFSAAVCRPVVCFKPNDQPISDKFVIKTFDWVTLGPSSVEVIPTGTQGLSNLAPSVPLTSAADLLV
jgi:hypothetical protein